MCVSYSLISIQNHMNLPQSPTAPILNCALCIIPREQRNYSAAGCRARLTAVVQSSNPAHKPSQHKRERIRDISTVSDTDCETEDTELHRHGIRVLSRAVGLTAQVSPGTCLPLVKMLVFFCHPRQFSKHSPTCRNWNHSTVKHQNPETAIISFAGMR